MDNEGEIIMKWYVAFVISILQWMIDLLWNFVDSNKDGKISKEEMSEIIDLIHQRLMLLKRRVQ